MHTLSTWVDVAESRSALLAIRRVAECVTANGKRRLLNPLFLHGPAGTGKTHLAAALVAEVTATRPDAVATILTASEVNLALRPDAEGVEPVRLLEEAREADLLVLEDVQHLDARTAETVIAVFDERQRRQQQMLFTASLGPGQLRHLPSRLTSRLATGLVVGIAPLSPQSRRAFLKQRVNGKPAKAQAAVLDWVADHVAGSVRQLEGALGRLETLYRLHGRPATLEEAQAAFEEDAEARRPTVERIAQRVGRQFQLDPRRLKDRDRSRHVLLPRQVSMYLARQLTQLSLVEIGAYFGGRDHSTVLHACRKVALALDSDPALSGIVRQLHADLA